MKRLPVLAVIAVILCPAPSLSAEGIAWATKCQLQGAYYPPNTEAYGITTGFSPIDTTVYAAGAGQRVLGTGWGSAKAKAILSEEVAIPFLRGDGPLFDGNNLTFTASGELSPVSVNAVAGASFTPIAFLKLEAGAAVGTGWSIGFIGLALNPPSDTQPLREIPFGGAVWRAWGSATLQFDLAALLPGEWNHVVAVASPLLQYWACTAAGDGEAWMWEADDGYDFNGWKLEGTCFLGYRMPLVLNTVGFLLETEQWLGPVASSSPMASGGWGSDFVSLNFGPLFNFSLGKKSSIAVLVQFMTAQRWTDATTQNRYFGNRQVDQGHPVYLYFNRVVFNYSFSL
jgi:hypothetical protein